ncbi:hypothetical protein KIPB_011544, partial [Kipferlia bialata]|eukprot:g11544.t1
MSPGPSHGRQRLSRHKYSNALPKACEECDPYTYPYTHPRHPPGGHMGSGCGGRVPSGQHPRPVCLNIPASQAVCLSYLVCILVSFASRVQKIVSGTHDISVQSAVVYTVTDVVCIAGCLMQWALVGRYRRGEPLPCLSLPGVVTLDGSPDANPTDTNPTDLAPSSASAPDVVCPCANVHLLGLWISVLVCLFLVLDLTVSFFLVPQVYIFGEMSATVTM